MSQPAAVASASFARSSPRCQLWTSLPRLPSGFSRLWSGPATKPSREIDMWQVVSGIGVLQATLVARHATALVRRARGVRGHRAIDRRGSDPPAAGFVTVRAGGGRRSRWRAGLAGAYLA